MRFHIRIDANAAGKKYYGISMWFHLAFENRRNRAHEQRVVVTLAESLCSETFLYETKNSLLFIIEFFMFHSLDIFPLLHLLSVSLIRFDWNVMLTRISICMYRKTVQQLSSESTSACLYDEHTPSSSYRLRYNNIFFFRMEVKEGPNHHAYIYICCTVCSSPKIHHRPKIHFECLKVH